ncbi:MAG: hypothetical protein Q9M26_08745 [Mariprofundales bacterium]|nr:hypothetical protein [Mariprofundales bacterium]
MTIGLIIIAGVVAIFISQNKVQSGEAHRSELLADLQLSSGIIQSELRQAQDVYSCGNAVVYQPLDSTVATTATCPVTVDAANGAFKLIAAGASGCSTSNTGCICWDRPNQGSGCQEMMRNIKASTGLNVTVDAYGVYTVTITGQFNNAQHSLQDLAMGIHVWPRN